MKIRRQQKGFSLAEVLISITVVSVMLAIVSPVLTKHVVGDNTWNWTQTNTKDKNSVGNGTSYDGDSAVIGKRSTPQKNELNNDYFTSFTSGSIKDRANAAIEGSLKSKLSIVKPIQNGSPFSSSHISLYNINNKENEYVGRLASDQYNLALGVGTLQSLSSSNDGKYNTAIGHYALANNTTGQNNTALGYGALLTNTTGNENTAVGHMAGANMDNENGKGSKNTIIGNFLGNKIDEIAGDRNLIIGNHFNNYAEGQAVRSWQNDNILLGHNAGRGLPSGWGNNEILAIGNVDLNGNDDQKVELIQASMINDAGRKIVINGDLVIRSGDGKKTLFKVDASDIAISQSGHLNLAEITGPARCEGAEICIAKFKSDNRNNSCSYEYGTEKFDIYIKGMLAHRNYSDGKPTSLLGDALYSLDRCKDTNGIMMNGLNGSGGLSNLDINSLGQAIFGSKFTTDLGSYIQDFFGTSDARLKNIYGDSTAGLKEINTLKIKNYTYKADKTKTPHVGVIAQELQKIFPNSVIEGSDGYLSITQEEMFYGLIKSIQELADKNDKVAEKIALSKEQIEYTTKQNKLIEQENKLLEKQNKEFAKRIKQIAH